MKKYNVLLSLLLPLSNLAQDLEDYRLNAHLYLTEQYIYSQNGWRVVFTDSTTKGKLFISDHEVIIDINGKRTEYKQYIYRRKSISLKEWGGWQLAKNIQLFFDKKTYTTFILKIYEGSRLIKMYFWG